MKIKILHSLLPRDRCLPATDFIPLLSPNENLNDRHVE
jgi:hypothetical protein